MQKSEARVGVEECRSRDTSKIQWREQWLAETREVGVMACRGEWIGVMACRDEWIGVMVCRDGWMERWIRG